METFETIIRYSVHAALAFYTGIGLYALTEHIKFYSEKKKYEKTEEYKRTHEYLKHFMK